MYKKIPFINVNLMKKIFLVITGKFGFGIQGILTYFYKKKLPLKVFSILTIQCIPNIFTIH